MEETARKQLETFDAVSQPAVFVCGGKILYANPAAAAYGIEPEQDAESIVTDSEEDGVFLKLEEKTLPARRSEFLDGVLYLALPEKPSPSVGLGTLSAIAQAMREPLTNLFSASSPLFPQLEELENPSIDRSMATINQSHYRLMHLLCNIQDAPAAINGELQVKREKTELCNFLQSLYDAAEPLCAACGYTLRLTLPEHMAYAWLDPLRLSRAIYNLISNAIRHTQEKGEIGLCLALTEDYAIIEVRDEGSMDGRLQDVFGCLTDRPYKPDFRKGGGFGLAIVRATARAHGGTFVITAPSSGGTSAALSLTLRAPEGLTTELRTPMVKFDYTGGFRQEFIEMADILPRDVFDSMNIN